MSDLIECTFTGDAFVPRTTFMLRRAKERFGDGEIVCMNAEEERSMRKHRWYFVQLTDYWRNLPERLAPEPWAQSMDALRKRLLIWAGYRSATVYVCATKAEAGRLAAAIRPLDAFGVVTLEGVNVVRFTAESQSVKSMGKDRFKASADAVLGLAETLVSGGELPAMGMAA